MAGKPLTEKQRQIYTLLERNPDETFASVAQRMGVNRATVREHYLAACKKKGVDPTPRLKPDGSQVGIEFGKMKNKSLNKRLAKSSISRLDEERQAKALMAATDPTLATIKAAAEEAGVSPGVMSKFMTLLSQELGSTQTAIKEARIDNVKKLFGSTVERILGKVTEEDIENASLRDKMVAAGIATEKWLLMRGQPTQILAVEERMKLDEIAPAILKELERRGVDLILDPSTGAYSPAKPVVKTGPLYDVMRDQDGG